jgi:hypothetical protein
LLKKDGIQGCLKKPIQLNELLTAITSWLSFWISLILIENFLSKQKKCKIL